MNEMFPLIGISEMVTFNGESVEQFTGRYAIFVAAFKTEAGRTNFLKRGMTRQRIGDQLLFWHGIPPAPIKSFEEAMRVATAARADPESVIGQLKVPPTTKIYFAMAGQPAEEQG